MLSCDPLGVVTLNSAIGPVGHSRVPDHIEVQDAALSGRVRIFPKIFSKKLSFPTA
jgi:hypothetical protein